MPNCDICNKPAKGVASSPLGPISNAYCQECLDARREPWGVLVAGLYGVNGSEALIDWARPIVKATLAFYNKTEEQLWAEVKQFGDEYEAYLEQQPND